ncbi:hypothetical protein GCM10012290_04840 [Halolactibacillus alkaliphilus]|uniref:DUF624 domain-containing protein n=1 Tax=Halolactibacillus alkaliphilus TaxID=442899 RepID=A0A511WZ95_9BACI|nr:DUF624 domain-containing protein [Halolactibacillus alkaliphilus]GEN55882.1 hypothetical protein HAL01_03460 [Halolactibacillus alkaliphilus]GGN65775.1 hypothetical protein GCM10012290_04840 [Halolactibacillus alkaliphilus]SFO66227.1 Uncharacterized membrane protein YesL [Halolactibacillus alkaliphilus]
MCRIGTKIVSWTVQIYHFIVLAGYFWLGILKGLILYGVVPACVSVIKTYEDIKVTDEVDEKFIKKRFFDYYRDYDHYKVLSFVMSLGVLLLMSLFMLSLARGVSLILVVVCIYFLLLLVGAMSYTFYHLTLKKESGRLAFSKGFVVMIKELKTTVPLLIAVVVLIGVLYYNLVLFLVVFPAGYAAVVSGILHEKMPLS